MDEFIRQYYRLSGGCISLYNMEPTTNDETSSDYLLNLSPRLSSRNELDNYFICKICLKVVREPVECDSCQTCFCKGCISQWGKQSSCPLRCTEVSFKPIHRFALSQLKMQTFSCAYSQKCEVSHKYEQALEHLESCTFRPIDCSCGKKYEQGQVGDHAAQGCDLAKEYCVRCKSRYPYRNRDTHDCLKTLKDEIIALNKKVNLYEKKLGVKCPQGHFLYPQQGPLERQIRQYGQNGSNTYCDCCEKEHLQLDNLYWRCLENCDYDLCHDCLYNTKQL
ncbi:hypothetical protein FGO68_gene962 [Halteria grandinella]|uniref:RING-type domain-containing protein n=1 Tax=Halteria grandinella TaxID=5974 RepID=A0A8J8NJH7_HALGN|nr:hypothetical protein FGO68_gene962 [Halteria grandinella]